MEDNLRYNYFMPYSMWFWVQPEHGDHEDYPFYWNRDCIYIAIILLGIGGATLMVLSLSMVSILIGDFNVNLCTVLL